MADSSKAYDAGKRLLMFSNFGSRLVTGRIRQLPTQLRTPLSDTRMLVGKQPFNVSAARAYGRRLSVPIRRSLREEVAEWTRLINDAGDRGSSKNPAAVGENSRKSIADWMHPIRVEKRWGGRTIRQGEGATGRPRLRRELFFEPDIRNVQHLPGIGDAFGIALGLRSQSIRHQRLHRTHNVVVKEPIHKAHR